MLSAFLKKRLGWKINFYLASGLLTHPQFDDGSTEVVETVMLRFTVYEDLNIHCKTEFLQQSSGWILWKTESMRLNKLAIKLSAHSWRVESESNFYIFILIYVLWPL